MKSTHSTKQIWKQNTRNGVVMGPKEIDVKLQEFEIRLAMVNKDLQELIKTAKDIEDRANAILGKSK